MIRKNFLICFFALLFFIASASATKIVVINETEEKVYSLGEVTLSGDLDTNLLKISGSGEVITGEKPKVYLFGPASDVLVKNLLVNNEKTSVSFDENGYFFVAKEGGKFNFKADLEIKTIGQIRLFVPGPLNKLVFDLKNGYAIGGDQFGLYQKQIIIQRKEEISQLVKGNFRFSYAEKNEFLYIINFQAFGKSLGGYELDLLNQETITSVTGALKWEQKGNKLLLDLESEKATVTIRGLFNSLSLRIPLKEDRHHVVIESDPEKKISISTSAEEIDLSESGITPQYSNARAFLASRQDIFTITIKDLSVLPSLSASVSHATNKVAITSKGSVLGELNYRYANTGVDYLEIDVEGDPLYASTERQPIKLTQDEKLLLSFPKTQWGNLDLVYFTTREPLEWVNFLEIPLAKTDLPITEAQTTIYLPQDYVVLETLGAPGGNELPSLKSAILFILILGALGYLLKRKNKFVFYYLIFSAGLVYFDMRIFLLMVALSIFFIVKPRIPKAKWILYGAGLLVAIIIFLIIPFFFIWQLGIFGGGPGGVTRMEGEYAMMDEIAAPAFKGMETIGEGEGAITVPKREGVLPVNLELPRLGKSVQVKNYLVTKENQINLKLILISAKLKYLLYLIALLAGILAYKQYKEKK